MSSDNVYMFDVWPGSFMVQAKHTRLNKSRRIRGCAKCKGGSLTKMNERRKKIRALVNSVQEEK